MSLLSKYTENELITAIFSFSISPKKDKVSNFLFDDVCIPNSFFERLSWDEDEEHDIKELFNAAVEYLKSNDIEFVLASEKRIFSIDEVNNILNNSDLKKFEHLDKLNYLSFFIQPSEDLASKIISILEKSVYSYLGSITRYRPVFNFETRKMGNDSVISLRSVSMMHLPDYDRFEHEKVTDDKKIHEWFRDYSIFCIEKHGIHLNIELNNVRKRGFFFHCSFNYGKISEHQGTKIPRGNHKKYVKLEDANTELFIKILEDFNEFSGLGLKLAKNLTLSVHLDAERNAFYKFSGSYRTI